MDEAKDVPDEKCRLIDEELDWIDVEEGEKVVEYVCNVHQNKVRICCNEQKTIGLSDNDEEIVEFPVITKNEIIYRCGYCLELSTFTFSERDKITFRCIENSNDPEISCDSRN